MKFNLYELPLSDFELLGLSKKDFLSLPGQTKGSLLNGGRTSFIRFNNIRSKEGRKYYLDARLSLERNNDGEVKLKMHPRQSELKNKFGLNSIEQDYLSKNPDGFVDKTISSMGDKKLSVYYDSLTNEYIAIDRNKINPPHSINGTALTEEQKIEFKNGKAIETSNSKISLKPTSETGIEQSGIENIDFEKYAYSRDEKFFDITLLALGYSHIILLEHFLRYVMIDIKNQQENQRLIQNQQVNKALTGAHEEILVLKKDAQRNNRQIEPDDVKNIINHHLVQEGVTNITAAETINKNPGIVPDLKDDKTQKKNKQESRPASVIAEILAIDNTDFPPNFRKAITDTQTQLNELKRFDVVVPDGAAKKILSHHLSKNGIDISAINLRPGNLLASLKELQAAQKKEIKPSVKM